MLETGEIDLKIRNKQYQLENLAKQLSKDLKRNNSGDAPEIKHSMRKSGEAEKEAYIQQELQQVKHAILRMKQGTYSECELCLGDIGGARLLALPYTALCSPCASLQ